MNLYRRFKSWLKSKMTFQVDQEELDFYRSFRDRLSAHEIQDLWLKKELCYKPRRVPKFLRNLDK